MTSGIYCIKNINDGKMYIGQSVDVDKRWQTHKWLLKNNNHFNVHLQRAYNLDKDSFEFSVIEYCSAEELNEKEIYYIRYFDTMENGYNLCEGGESTTGRVCSDETKKKISAKKAGRKCTKETIQKRTTSLKEHFENDPKFKEEFIAKAKKNLKGGWNKGIPLTDERKAFMRKVNLGKVISEDHKNKLRELYKGENSITAKLKEKDVIEMRLRFLKGEKRMNIANDYSFLHPNTVYDIVKGKRWKHLPNTVKELEEILCNYN